MNFVICVKDYNPDHTSRMNGNAHISNDVWIGIQYSIMCAMMHHGFAVSHKAPSVKLGRWRE